MGNLINRPNKMSYFNESQNVADCLAIAFTYFYGVCRILYPISSVLDPDNA